MGPAVVCFRAHSGWAVLVTVAGPAAAPSVVQRRRVEMADRAIRGSVQPYHAAKEMPLEEAASFLEECAHTAAAKAEHGLRDAIADARNRGFQISSSGVLMGSGRPTPDLARTLASHAMIHTAEGHFFRNALKAACEACRLPVALIREKDLTGPDFPAKPLCPPWRQDHKLCAAAAWLLIRNAELPRDRAATL